MQTHDEDTRRYFKHSSVQVLLCPRAAGKKHSWMKQRVWVWIDVSFIIIFTVFVCIYYMMVKTLTLLLIISLFCL